MMKARFPDYDSPHLHRVTGVHTHDEERSSEETATHAYIRKGAALMCAGFLALTAR